MNEVIALQETVIAEEKANQEKEKESSRDGGRGGGRYNDSSKYGGDSKGGYNAGAPSYDPYASEAPSYRVGDTVSARWISGDKSFYPARITGITGSATAPVYIVKFTNYNVSETLQASNIKPLSTPSSNPADSKKRKLDTPTGPKPHSVVISQPANINSALAEERRKEAVGGVLGAERKPAKKLKHGKELNEGKKKWLEFASKGVKMGGGARKKIGESSMFRTPEGVHGRGTHFIYLFIFLWRDPMLTGCAVGFTGSGQPMRKELGHRGKHIFQENDEDD